MEISGLSLQSVYTLQAQTQDQQNADATGSLEVPAPGTEVLETPPTSTEPAVQETEDEGKASGVLRKMQEGHFKGVADVRLRINFFDEISALESQQLQTVAQENIGVVVKSVKDSFPKLLKSEGFTGEQKSEIGGFQETFAGTVNVLMEEFTAGDENSKEDLLTGLGQAFDDLLGSLTGVLSGTITEATEEVPAPGDDVAEEIVVVNPFGNEEDPEPESAQTSDFNLEAFLDELRADFDKAMASLSEALNDIQVLPALSEPKGNGVAFDKFLAIYNELQSSNTASDNSEQFETMA